jgi:hypothetical protein
MLQWARRYLVVATLGFWLGGFTLYTAVVIRVGHRRVPGGRFGFVTAEVTGVLDILAALAVLALALNLALDWKRTAGRLRGAALVGTVLLGGLVAGSFAVHAQLDRLLDYSAREISDPVRFRAFHQRYEMLSTLAWFLGLALLGHALAAWRRVDAAR